MSQAAATKLVSKLKFKIHDRRRLSNPDGPQGRHNKIKKTITALLKHERIELNYHRADESRGYAERLLSEAIRNGDCHKPTMDLASYWIIEPQIVHKLFKVLVPRYQFSEQSYTKLWRAPNVYPGHGRPKCVLELRNNIYPPLEPDKTHQKNQIHNVLLEEAKKEYMKMKEKEALAKKAMKEDLRIKEKEALVEKAENEYLKIKERAMASAAANASQPEINENLKTESAMDENVNSEAASELPSETDLKADCASGDENEVKIETNSSSETDVDLSNLKIEDEKQKTTSDDEKR